ncbi:MAG: 30S ribosome-binding factor RbfA [Bacilli bacterium]|jgi:ribosome-binding factor A|nr:30S ribosome-binding factor RbfA [Bacilli bacterium]
MADKKGRVNEIIQRNLSEIIIYQLKDPITQFASINEVKVTDDYSYCKVYCSHVQEEKADELVNYLNNNAKKIRTLLSKTLSIFKTPELFFIRDVSFEKGKAMDDLIEKAVHSKPRTLKDIQAEEKKAKKDAALKAKKAAAKKKAAKKAAAAKPAKKAVKKAAKKA